MLQGNRLFKGLPKEIVLQSKSDLCLLYAVVRKCTHYKVTRIIGMFGKLALKPKETSTQVAILNRICRLKWGDRIELSVLHKFRSK